MKFNTVLFTGSYSYYVFFPVIISFISLIIAWVLTSVVVILNSELVVS